MEELCICESGHSINVWHVHVYNKINRYTIRLQQAYLGLGSVHVLYVCMCVNPKSLNNWPLINSERMH